MFSSKNIFLALVLMNMASCWSFSNRYFGSQFPEDNQVLPDFDSVLEQARRQAHRDGLNDDDWLGLKGGANYNVVTGDGNVVRGSSNKVRANGAVVHGDGGVVYN